MRSTHATGRMWLAGAVAAAGMALASGAAPRTTALQPDGAPKAYNREVSPLADGTRKGLRLDQREGDGLAWWPDTVLAEGTIEFDVRGKDLPQQSFVGVAFHGADEKTYDAVYFRPFNFKAEDPARRVRAVQYVAHPTYTWNKLRAERPGEFERAVSPVPDPNGWFHVRIVLAGARVRVFVDDATQPSLEVTQLSDRKRGWVGFWVGNGSAGDFANLKVTPSR